MNVTQKNDAHAADRKMEQRCTAPHPFVSFMYFAATVVAVGLLIYAFFVW